MPLDRLRSVTDGTLQIAILEGTDVLYVERREGPGAIPVFRAVGARNAAYRTSSGKLLIAFLPAEQRIRAIDSMKLRPRTPRTITSRTRLVAELDQIRRRGYAENRGESEPEMCSIAAPVRDRLGRVVASVSVAIHTDQVADGLPHLVRPVVQTAERISLALGWSK